MNREFFISAWACLIIQAQYSLAAPTKGNAILQYLFLLLSAISIVCWGVTRKDD